MNVFPITHTQEGQYPLILGNCFRPRFPPNALNFSVFFFGIVYLDCFSLACSSDWLFFFLTDFFYMLFSVFWFGLLFKHYVCLPSSPTFDLTNSTSLHVAKASDVLHTDPDPVSWAFSCLLEEAGIEFRLPVMTYQKYLLFLGNLLRNLTKMYWFLQDHRRVFYLW